MEKLVIQGPVTLSGEVTISGAKNAALPMMAAALLAPGESHLHNMPRLQDLITMSKVLAIMGCDVRLDWPSIKIDTTSVDNLLAPYSLVKTMRASVLVMGPMAARWGEARVSLPGGCAIGTRPINLHIAGLEAMGADVRVEHGYVHVKARRLRGAHIKFPQPTVTGTENLMMAATLAKGTTVLENAAREPEIEDLALMLNKMGARIRGAGTPIITIEGVDELQPVSHHAIPDRIEAGTFLVAGAVTGGNVLARKADPRHLEAVLEKLRMAGADITIEREGIRVRGTDVYTPLDIMTAPYPGFPTDMQAQFMILMLKSRGQSMLTETIFENRFMHVPELMRMGADIEVKGRTAIVNGPAHLSGTQVMATDLRASASLVLAGLISEGTTEVLRIYHMDRGYEKLEEKLAALGANIRREKTQMY